MPAAWPVAWAALAALSAFAIASAGTWLARRYALRRGMLDAPGDRRSHVVPTPRGGGVAIVAGWLPAVALAGWLGGAGAWRPAAIAAAGAMIVAAVGWIDDHRPLPALPRLAAHAVAALLLAVAAWMSGAGPAPAVVAFVLALGLANAWNFIDGIDGIAASQAAIAAAAFALVTAGAAGLPALALAAACLGFLPWNFPRARIFMGDVGSGSVGYALAAAAVAAMAQAPRSAWPLLLLPLLPVLVDTSLTLGRRIVTGQRWWTPHVTHAYQVQARRHGHRRVTLAFALATACLSALAVSGRAVWPESFAFNIVILMVSAPAAAWAWTAATSEAQQDPPT